MTEPKEKNEMDVIEWKDPIESEPTRVERVATELRSRPDEWALIELGGERQTRMSWWRMLDQDQLYEVKTILSDVHYPDGPRDVYARYHPLVMLSRPKGRR